LLRVVGAVVKREHERRREGRRLYRLCGGKSAAASLMSLCLALSILPAAAAESTSSVVDQMDSLWDRRPDGESLRRLIEIGEQATGERAEFEVAWRISRACVYLGETQENRTLRKALAVKGMEWARKAMEMKPERVEGHYFYGSTVGQYGATVGMASAVAQGIAGKFEESMNKSYEIDRDYDDGGSMIALGRFFYVLPWPKHDLKRSRLLLEEAKQRHPKRLLARLYLADTYYDLGKKTKARQELRHILESDIPPDERPMPFHELARQRLQEWFQTVS
jgi:hypothetical protein